MKYIALREIKGLWAFYFLGSLLLLTCLWYIWWQLFCVHVYAPKAYVTPRIAEELIGLPIPASAKKIRVADYRLGRGFSTYVRFEAPVQDCVDYAIRLLGPRKSFPSKAIPADPRNVDACYLPNLSWFNVANNPNLIGAEYGPAVWVDRLKGVFYFYNGF